MFLNGSNPHSNGVNFSFSFSIGKFVKKNTITKTTLNIKENKIFINILVYSLSGKRFLERFSKSLFNKKKKLIEAANFDVGLNSLFLF